ncbi:hypothetical protein Bca4012_027163 [Brassica carinata]|uniref:Uncharacterized protein n=1 Tax=Brassica carinata TaxID=52824 RepID=A0A8X7VJX5_BRACI|nr:hypothetical protein Bca52824_024161 [Brassica carinata]
MRQKRSMAENDLKVGFFWIPTFGVRGMLQRMVLALKINRGESMEGFEHTGWCEAPVMSGFAIHLYSLELDFHTPCIFFPSLESLFF